MDSDDYFIGVFIVGGLSFVGIWFYAMAQWGLLLGLIFGWIPAMIGGVMLGFLWPLVIVALLFMWAIASGTIKL